MTITSHFFSIGDPISLKQDAENVALHSPALDADAMAEGISDRTHEHQARVDDPLERRRRAGIRLHGAYELEHLARGDAAPDFLRA